MTSEVFNCSSRRIQWANRVAVTISTSSTTATATTTEPRQYTPYRNIVYTRHGQSLRGDNDPIQLLLAYMKREYSGLLTALGRQRPKGKKEKQRLKREHVKQDVCYLSIRRTRIRIAPRGVYSVSSDVYIYTKAYRIVLYCIVPCCAASSNLTSTCPAVRPYNSKSSLELVLVVYPESIATSSIRGP